MLPIEFCAMASGECLHFGQEEGQTTEINIVGPACWQVLTMEAFQGPPVPCFWPPLSPIAPG